MDESAESSRASLSELLALIAGAACALALSRDWPLASWQAGVIEFYYSASPPKCYRGIEQVFRYAMMACFAAATVAAYRCLRLRRGPRLGEWLASLLAVQMLVSARAIPSPGDLVSRHRDYLNILLGTGNQYGSLLQGPAESPWLIVFGAVSLLAASASALAALGPARRGPWAFPASFFVVWGVLPCYEMLVSHNVWYLQATDRLFFETIVLAPAVAFLTVPATWAGARLLFRARSSRPWTDRLGVLSFLVAGGAYVVLAQCSDDGNWLPPLEAIRRSACRWGTGLTFGLALAAGLGLAIARRLRPKPPASG